MSKYSPSNKSDGSQELLYSLKSGSGRNSPVIETVIKNHTSKDP